MRRIAPRRLKRGSNNKDKTNVNEKKKLKAHKRVNEKNNTKAFKERKQSQRKKVSEKKFNIS
jgi:hypothetical protein